MATTVTDLAGNSTIVTNVVKIDKSAPTLSITSPADNSTVTDPALIISGSVQDNTSGTGGSARITINGSTVTINPDNRFSHSITLAEGANMITIIATDAAGNSSTATLTITLLSQVNEAPVITSSANTTATIDQAYEYAVTATDVNTNDVLTYGLDRAPVGMTIDPNTGLIQWTPAISQRGSHTIIARAQDAGGFSEQSWDIIVVDGGLALDVTIGLEPPIANIGETVTITVAVENAAGAFTRSLTISSLTMNGADLALDASGQAQYTVTASGSYELIATVTCNHIARSSNAA